MLEMKLTKGRMISSDGKFNFILMNGDKAIGYYNTWERLHESMNRGNKKLSKKDLEKINEVSASDDTYEIVRSEFEDRLNYDVLFFRAGKYHEFGKKLFKQQDHYFNTL